MYLLCVYVPESHLEVVKNAIHSAGGGKIGDYDSCSWQIKGSGQFRPLAGSQPHLGKHGMVERVDEFKLEVIVEGSLINLVVAAMKSAHPYEEPAFHYFEVMTS